MKKNKNFHFISFKSTFFIFAARLFISTTLFISLAAILGCSGGGGGFENSRTPYSGEFYNKIHGICFSPYIDGQSPGAEITEQQILSRLKITAPFCQWIRTYGCSGGLEKTGRLARILGLKTAMGAWLGSDMAANEIEINNLIKAALNGDADIAIVGNEVMSGNPPALTEEQLISYIRRIRKAVPPSVQVACAEGAAALLEHPAIMDECGVVLVQIHPYWGGVPVERAVADLADTFNKIRAAAKGKKVIISEAGWPDAGAANGEAMPSAENAAFYLKNLISWSRANGIDAYIFSAFDEKWKDGTELNSVGSHWGMFYSDGTIKPSMAEFFKGGGWGVNDKNGIIEIAYGSNGNYPQYAALHTASSYFRMNCGGGWGTSAILAPSFWKGGTLYQGTKISHSWKIEKENLVIHFNGRIETLDFSGTITIAPPSSGLFTARIEVSAPGGVSVDNRPGEAFQYIKLSSMNIGGSSWDSQYAYIGAQIYRFPENGWIVSAAVKSRNFGLKGGSSSWKANAPTIDILSDEEGMITGWLTKSSNPNDDNIGLWAADDRARPSWSYTITARP